MDTDLDTLATALYVTTDDLLRAHPERVPTRPRGSFQPLTSDAEMLTLAVMQAVLGHPSEARWLRYARKHLRPLFPNLPLQPGYNKRLRKLAATMSWLADRTTRPPDQRGHRRRMGGGLHPGGVRPLPGDRGAFRPRRMGRVRLLRLALTVLLGTAAAPGVHPARVTDRLGPDRRQSRRTRGRDRAPGHHRGTSPRRVQLLIADKNYYVRAFESELDAAGIDLLRKACKGEKPRPGGEFFKPLRQVVDSVFDTFKGQLDLEHHYGKTIAGVATRITQRVLALTAVIWHNDRAGAPVLRSLTAYNH